MFTEKLRSLLKFGVLGGDRSRDSAQFPCSLHKSFLSTGLAFKLIELYNNHDVLVRSIPGAVLAHNTMKGNALFLSPVLWSIITGNYRTGNVGSNRAKIWSYNTCAWLFLVQYNYLSPKRACKKHTWRMKSTTHVLWQSRRNDGALTATQGSKPIYGFAALF